MWAESIVLASILFSYASGHNKDFSVVYIQQSTSIQSIIHDKAKTLPVENTIHTHRVSGKNNGDHGMKTSKHP